MREDSEEIVMRNLKITLAYDGSEFSGWQVQPGLATIQGTLASAIGRLTGEKVLPQGSGRTDAGVHALEQVASFTTDSNIPVANWQKALNDILPVAIRMKDVSGVGGISRAEVGARKTTAIGCIAAGCVRRSWRDTFGIIRFRSTRRQ
jgi:tRNA pseudouridine38-40 synthase